MPTHTPTQKESKRRAFEKELNEHYKDRGMVFDTLNGAKSYLKENEFKRIGGNLYRTKQWKEAYLTRLFRARYPDGCDNFEEQVTSGYLVTFTGFEPISGDRTIIAKRYENDL